MPESATVSNRGIAIDIEQHNCSISMGIALCRILKDFQGVGHKTPEARF